MYILGLLLWGVSIMGKTHVADLEAKKSDNKGDTCLREIPRLLTKEEIRSLSEINSGKVVLASAVEVLLIVAAVALSKATWFNPLTYLLALIVIGTRIPALGGLMHEAAHHRIFRNRTLNDFFGELLAFPTTASMAGYRNTHFAHHRELNSHKDPDWTRNLLLEDYAFPMPQYLFLRKLVLHATGIKARQALGSFHNNPQTRDIPVLTARLRLAAFAALLVGSIAFGFWQDLLLYWVVPLLTVFLGWRYLHMVAEHYGVRHEGVLSETRTVIAPFWQRFLFGPWGLNYHLEHHLYPGITCFNLAEAHRILMTRPAFAENAQITYGYFGGLFGELASAKPGERSAAIAALGLDPKPEMRVERRGVHVPVTAEVRSNPLLSSRRPDDSSSRRPASPPSPGIFASVPAARRPASVPAGRSHLEKPTRNG
jgi:fatty acid desaturase